MNIKFRISTRFLLLSLILAYSIAPFVSRAISHFLTTYSYLLIVLLTFFVIICARKLQSLNLYISILLPFILYQLLTYLTNADSIVMWGYSVLLFLLPITIAYYVIYERPKYALGLSKAVRIFIIITLITTIVGLARFPTASRVLATIASSQDPEFVLYNWNNIGGYNFIYTLVLLYPLLILAFKQKKISIPATATLSVAIGAVIVMSEYTTALLLFLLSSVLFLFKRELTVKNMILFSILGVISVLVFSETFSDMLMWLAGRFDSEILKERLTALAGGTVGLESSEDNRIFLYRMSLNTFLSHPILGTMLSGGTGSGGHAQILDTLAVYGIAGGVLMIWMYRYIYLFFLKPFKQEKGFGYVVWFMVQAMFLSAINTGFWFEVLALYGPLILYSIYYKREIINKNTA